MPMNGWMLAAGAAVLLLSAACSGNSAPAGQTGARPSATASPRPPATAMPRPAGVPADTVYIAVDRTFGADLKSAGAPQLFHLGCKDGILSVVTSQVLQIYASLPCDRMVPQSVLDRFGGQPVQIRVTFGVTEKLYVTSPAAGTIEFTIIGAWGKE